MSGTAGSPRRRDWWRGRATVNTDRTVHRGRMSSSAQPRQGARANTGAIEGMPNSNCQVILLSRRSAAGATTKCGGGHQTDHAATATPWLRREPLLQVLGFAAGRQRDFCELHRRLGPVAPLSERRRRHAGSRDQRGCDQNLFSTSASVGISLRSCHYLRGRSMSTTSEFSRTRSNRIRVPSGDTSKPLIENPGCKSVSCRRSLFSRLSSQKS